MKNKTSALDFCEKHGLTVEQFYGRERHEGYLYLRSLTSIPEGFNPTVGGSLNLSSLTSIPEGFNPTVGGYLNLRSLTSIPEGFNPTVGGYLYTKGKETRIGAKVDTNFFWLKDDNTRYAIIDGLFCQILSERTKDEYSIYNAKEIGKKETFYIVNKDGYYAHSDQSIDAAINDLVFKIASERLKNKPINRDTIMTVQHYRLVTGACEFGCRAFMDKYGIEYEVIEGQRQDDSANPRRGQLYSDHSSVAAGNVRQGGLFG